MALTVDAVGAMEMERKVVEVLNAFYKTFFSNSPITLSSGREVTWPKLDIIFGQSEASIPTGVTQVHTIIGDMRPRSAPVGDKKLMRVLTSLTQYVRVSQVNGPKAEFQCRYIADCMRLLWESEKILIAQKGLRHARVTRGPVAIAAPVAQTRLLVVNVEVHYHAAL